MLERYSGGYGGGVPPLSIPNREVKPACADGTADCGRVGGRHLKGVFLTLPFFVSIWFCLYIFIYQIINELQLVLWWFYSIILD